MKSVSAQGCARGFGFGALLGVSLLDFAAVGAEGHDLRPSAAVLAVGLAALLWPVGRRPAWLTPQVRTAAPAVVSLALTVAVVLTGGQRVFGPGEITIMLCLLFIAVRHCPPRWAVVCGTLAGVAGLALPVGFARSLTDDQPLGFMVVGLLLIGLVGMLAGYLRSLDFKRTVAVAETRRDERVAIAADLHDFVAHHVTGILVQTQVARMMAEARTSGTSESSGTSETSGLSGSDDLDPVLAGIERAATEALASMRLTVGVLRDTGQPDAADHRPVGDLAGISDLLEGFASPGQKVTLHRDPALSDDLPHEVQAAAFRVVQEALTNVRRHAADATEISVGLWCEDQRLMVAVADDGRGGTQLPAAARGGGFGLVGLTERVTALGGTLWAGPRVGHGWEVRAAFPQRKSL
ncbi:sensor histidine kinase [Streptomyces sp. NBC_00286]|uniref:sensor histidine kinase n=1 Tax=Streptomyces sp. NBC_00286 TaxID=2975701 RepID=UPI002E285034|nr:ATP-binding protein [Streptomyces sp. NBC_00286]